MVDMKQPEKKPESPPLPNSCPHQVTYGLPAAEEEVNLMDYWRVIWPRRKMIVAITFAAALLAVVISLAKPNIYRAEVLLAPVGGEKGKGGLSAALGNLGGLASMAGISLPGGGNVEENLAVLKSREFIGKFVQEKNLLPLLFADEWDQKNKRWKDSAPKDHPGPWDAYRLLTENVMKVSQNKNTSLVTVAIEWTDPQQAAGWANESITRLNSHLRGQAIARSQINLRYLNEALADTHVADMRQTLFTLIAEEHKKAMLANTQEEFAFRVLDQAAAPDRKAKPHRSKMVFLATIVGGMLAIFLVLFLEWIKQQRDKDL